MRPSIDYVPNADLGSERATIQDGRKAVEICQEPGQLGASQKKRLQNNARGPCTNSGLPALLSSNTPPASKPSVIAISGPRRVSGEEDVLAGPAIARSPGLLVRSCQVTGDSTKKIPSLLGILVVVAVPARNESLVLETACQVPGRRQAEC